MRASTHRAGSATGSHQDHVRRPDRAARYRIRVPAWAQPRSPSYAAQSRVRDRAIRQAPAPADTGAPDPARCTPRIEPSVPSLHDPAIQHEATRGGASERGMVEGSATPAYSAHCGSSALVHASARVRLTRASGVKLGGRSQSSQSSSHGGPMTKARADAWARGFANRPLGRSIDRIQDLALTASGPCKEHSFRLSPRLGGTAHRAWRPRRPPRE